MLGGSDFGIGSDDPYSFPGHTLAAQNLLEWRVVLGPRHAGGSGGSNVPLGATATSSTVSMVGDRESSTAAYTTFVAAGPPARVSIASTPNSGTAENDLFAATTAADGSTWAVGWSIDASGIHQTLIEQNTGGRWALVASPNTGTGDNGLAGVAAVPGGGLWAVGVSSSNGNFSTLVMYHP